MKKTIIINGMSCMNCVRHVKEALSELNGVSNVEVDLSSKTAVVDLNAEVLNEDIVKVLDEFGYEVESIK